MLNRLKNFDGLNITINTNEDCNLACKYCYEIDKKHKVIDFEKVKEFIDLILTDPNPVNVITDPDDPDYDRHHGVYSQGLIVDFIGGDSLMHPDIIENTLEYLMDKMLELKHPLMFKWKASISSNGCLFDNPEVRRVILKYKYNLSLGISIDGCPAIHDKNRIMATRGPNGEEIGSMDKILKWWPWVKANIPVTAISTKSTCSRDSIPYLYESLVFMHETLGMTYINQNFIMEDTGCTEEDYKLLDEQLEKCVNYVLEHRNDLYWSMIDKEFLWRRSKLKNYELREHFKTGKCGSGAMPALSIDGRIYGCFRWLPHTQTVNAKSKDNSVGSVKEGFSRKYFFNVIRKHNRGRISDKECFECEYEGCCAYCIGGCYAEFCDFKRTKYICEITKLLAKWAEVYWKKYCELENKVFDWDSFITKEGADYEKFGKDDRPLVYEEYKKELEEEDRIAETKRAIKKSSFKKV